VSTFQLYEKLKQSLNPETAEAVAAAFADFPESLQRTVRHEDFTALQEIVADLGLARKRAGDTMWKGFTNFNRRLDVLGSRWGYSAGVV